MLIRFLGLLTCVFLLVVSFQPSVSVAVINPFSIVEQEIHLEDENHWSEIPPLWIAEQAELLRDFVANQNNVSNRCGLLTIKSAKLVSSKELSQEVLSTIIPEGNYESYTNSAHFYYIAVDYRVHKESKFYLTGINYMIAVVVQENGANKIAELSQAPVDRIVQNKVGFDTEDERQMSEIVKLRYEGKFYNRDMEPIDGE